MGVFPHLSATNMLFFMRIRDYEGRFGVCKERRESLVMLKSCCTRISYVEIREDILFCTKKKRGKKTSENSDAVLFCCTVTQRRIMEYPLSLSLSLTHDLSLTRHFTCFVLLCYFSVLRTLPTNRN